jgi:hypothetical protein
MTFVDVYPPITAAAFLFAVWALILYRLIKANPIKEGTLTQIGWALLNPACLIAYFAYRGLDAPINGSFDMFMVAFGSMDVAVILLSLAKNGFYDAGRERGDIYLHRAGLVFLLAVIFGNVFI